MADVPPSGSFLMVRIEDLHIDTAYQRDISRDLVERIKREWDDAAIGAIVVSCRSNGDMYIVNGQHRTAAAMELGRTEILAQVLDGLDREGEAALRLRGNTRRGDTAQERFRAEVAAGNLQAIAIQEVCREYGTQVNPSPVTAEGINSVAAVESLYKLDGKGHLLAATLEVIQDAFGAVGGKVASGAMLKAVGWALVKHRDEMDRRRLVERMAAEGVDQIERKARSYRGAVGGALWTNYYRALLEAYNQRLAERQRLEPRTGGWTHAKTGGGVEFHR